MRNRPSGVSAWCLAMGIAACGSDPIPTDPISAPPLISGIVYPSDGSVSTAFAGAVYAPGETIHVQFDVRAELLIRWVGVASEGSVVGRDSISVPTGATRLTLNATLVAPTGFAGMFRVSGFARDRVGTYGEGPLAGNPVSVYATVVRPTLTAPVGAVRDFAFDATRGQVFLSEPGSSSVAVLSLATMQYGAAIATGEPPAGLDLTITGDSLAVALPASRALGIADLTVSPPAWSSVPLTIDTSYQFPDWLRVVSGNRAFITLGSTHSQGRGVGQLLEYDLGTGAQRLRLDAARYPSDSGRINGMTPLTRSLDRNRLAMLLDYACCPEGADVYLAQPDTFLFVTSVFSGYSPPVSLDAKGHRYLAGFTVFDSLLNVAEVLDPPGKGVVGALSLEGDTAYFAFGSGVLRTRLSDGVTTERVSVPETPVRIAVMPGGSNLLVFSAQHVYAIDLNGPPVAPALRTDGPHVPPSLKVQLRSN